MLVASPKCGAMALAFLLCAGSGAIAQELESYLEEIRANNPAYKAAAQRWQAAQFSVKAASALPDPVLGLGVYLQEVETRVGPQKQRISVSQKIPWRGKRALSGQQAQAIANRAKADFERVVLQLETEFKTLFAEFFYVGRAIEITQDHLQLLKDLEVVVTERYETSAAQYTDLIRIQIEIDALNDRLATQSAAALPIQAEMNALLNRKVDRELKFPSELSALTLADKSIVEAAALLQRHNPILRSFDHQIEADKTAVQLAKKNFYPDFNVGLDWINTGSSVIPGQPGSGRDPIVVSVGINLPIWRKKYRAIERSANSMLEASKYQRGDTTNHLEARLKRALFRWDDAGRKVALYRDHIIPKSEESLNVITSGFQTGENTYLDLIEAEKALLEFLLSLHMAQSNQMKALAAIEAVVGKDLSTRMQEKSDHGKLD